MERVYRMLEMVARGSISILVLGETGAGKEIAAETIHRFSPRSDRPLVALNCAALPEALLESELFGYERGAFTGAVAAKPGLLESAAGGTVFLDEVGELPLATQAKLLRVVETRQVTRIGGLAPRTVDMRLVSATNRDLEEMVRQGRFRQDLLFRLGAVRVLLPPLRERPLDIEPLAMLFLRRASAELGKREPAISAEARAWLLHNPWPGNVRELKNVMDRAVLLCAGGVLQVEHLQGPELMQASSRPAAYPPASVPPPPYPPAPSAPLYPPAAPYAPPQGGGEGAGLRGEVGLFERQRILEALERCNGNQTQAAKMLGISRRTLIDRLDAYDLPRPRKGRGPEGA
jgi:transcriptional regulator with GAF, ATPase, and Fis domain